MREIFLYVALGVLFTFEDVVRSRDRKRGIGSTADDRGTLMLLGLLMLSSWVVAAVLAGTLGDNSPVSLPGYPWLDVAGLLVFCAGLALRAWAIAELGRSFRTTVEVDTDQPVISTGPYRVVRHPAYTGLLLANVGCGLLSCTWPGLALLILLPLIGLLRRIRVEEVEMTDVLGQPYRDYGAHTKRLVPGVW
jgi:protein-S-isoprenylcysteine O-methyltransferase Ste14